MVFPAILSAILPTILKSAASGAVEGVKESIGVSTQPKDNVKATKAFIVAGIALAISYGVTVSNEWVNFLISLAPIIPAVLGMLFVISKNPKGAGDND